MAKMSPSVLLKISNQLKTFFEDTERFAWSSLVLKKQPFLSSISFYKEYYWAITFSNKGQEEWKKAEDAGSGMGTAAGILKYAMGLLTAAWKLALDSGT